MPDDESEDQPPTVFLKKPLADKKTEKSDESPTSTGKLVCLDTTHFDIPPDSNEYWLTRSEEVVGRGEGNTVQINSPEISRVHARFVSFSGKWIIEDGGSRNGVWVNGNRLESRMTLSSGDTIHLGRVPFRFEVLDIAPSELVQPVIADKKPPVPQPPSSTAETISLEIPEVERYAKTGAAGSAPAPDRAASTDREDTGVKRTLAMASLVGSPEDGAKVSELGAAVTLLREHLPEIISTLVERARTGDAEAARGCVDLLMHEEQRLAVDLELTGATPGHVKTIVSAMTDRKITPKQALDVLQVFATARELLRKRQA
jgi:hypothetical protein